MFLPLILQSFSFFSSIPVSGRIVQKLARNAVSVLALPYAEERLHKFIPLRPVMALAPIAAQIGSAPDASAIRFFAPVVLSNATTAIVPYPAALRAAPKMVIRVDAI